ncbi:MAG: alpha-amylase family glycosyl hydrolase, partial [Pseudomonadota bacterium]
MKKKFLSIIIIAIIAASCNSQTKPEEENQTMKKIHTPIPANKMVMYEIFVRNFSKEGNLKAVTAKLNDLKEMGVNTLWLMPIQPTGIEKHKGTYGSPYSVMNYTEVHPDFGTKADFKQLVDSCHALGMNIIIDHVANHTSWDNPWVAKHPDWFNKDSLGNIIPSVPDWTDIADLNYDNKEMRTEMIRCLQYWVKEFDLDGYRCDVAEMVPNDFWKEAIDSIRKIKNVVMLAEGADPKLYDAGFNITYGWDYYHNLKKIFKDDEPVTKLADVIADEKKKYAAVARQIRFITNHDENSWDNTPNELFGNINGTKAAYTIMA